MLVPIILAAGESIRMGRVKALCEFDGKTALEVALQTCRESDLAEPIVVLGHSREEIQSRVELNGVRVAVNEDYSRGQTSSLKCGLARLPAEAQGFFLYPVDYPCIAAEDVVAVVRARERMVSRGKRIFIPSYGLKRGHPALIDVELKSAFEALADDAPARTVINRNAINIHHVDVPHPYVLMDMDTPGDYDTCLQAFRRRARERAR